MMAFRQVDGRYPFLWEDAAQPGGRWHATGEGPAHYFADTPDGAWAEFLRHEEITDPADLATIRRQMWAIDIGEVEAETIDLPPRVLTGGPDSYPECQRASRTARARGAASITAPSAALLAGGARGQRVDDGVRPGKPREGQVIVLFGSPARFVGWLAADMARPPTHLLDRVRHYGVSS
jgi:hypothetical protein